MIYKCKDCNIERYINKTTIVFVGDKLETKEALCNCGIYMEQVYESKHKGMPNIIRNERNGK
tara:strand:+ start:4988 stop:5173 length:186 start_codon:yes stop_codon:yes gene_type:complete